MVLKIGAIAALVAAGISTRPQARLSPKRHRQGDSGSMIAGIGAAMTAVMFSYGGWQTSSFVAGEMRNPQRDLARGLLLGVDRCHRPLHRGRIYLRADSGPAVVGRLQNAGERRHAPGAWRKRRGLHRPRHRHLGAGLPQPGHADRTTCLFRHGRGRRLLPGAHQGQRAEPCAGRSPSSCRALPPRSSPCRAPTARSSPMSSRSISSSSV